MLDRSMPVDRHWMEQLVKDVVIAVIAEMKLFSDTSNGKLCFSEEEAAQILGLKTHQLRDARLAGKIRASQIVGRRIRYTQEDLIRYLRENEWHPKR